MAISLMVEGKKGISANQMKRHIGVTYKTAWYVCHRIREAMQEEKGTKIGGESITVEIDEMYVGGRKRGTGVWKGRQNKTVVMGMAERNGNIHLQTVKSRLALDMKPVLDAKLNPETDKIVTDGLTTYQFVIPKEKHVRGNHKVTKKS